MWPKKPVFSLIVWLCRLAIIDAFSCYSCANDFMIWSEEEKQGSNDQKSCLQCSDPCMDMGILVHVKYNALPPLALDVIAHWENFFTKRNYGLSSSEQACSSKRYASDFVQNCHTSCYSLNVTGTNRLTGKTAVVGYARGCSDAALADSKSIDELSALFGTKIPHIPFEPGNVDFLEHWCFCEGNLCNRHVCYSANMLPVDFSNSSVSFASWAVLIANFLLILIVQPVR